MLLQQAQRLWDLYRLHTKLKVIVSFFQIATKVGQVFQVTLPTSAAALLRSLEAIISLGLDLTAPFECLGARSYLQRLQFWLLTPLILGFSLCLVGIMGKGYRIRAGVMWALPAIMKMMFLLYSTINLRAFEAFRCYDFGIDGRWLMADVDVQCESPEHDSIKAWAWLAIVTYPIGWTATTAVLLRAARKSIVCELPPTALSKALSFIYEECRTGR